MEGQIYCHETLEGTKKVKRVWLISKLWEITKGFLIKDILIENIKELDQVTWFDNDYNQLPTCRQVAEHAKQIYNVEFNYPIILSAEGKVMDGMHRICKAYLLGRETIKAVQFNENPNPDEIYFNEN